VAPEGQGRGGAGGATGRPRLVDSAGDSACAVRRALPRRRCVLPGQLRCRAFLLLLLPVQPRLAAPGALEVVADVEGQAAHPLGLDLDPVAVLEATEPPVIGAGRDYVARGERV